MKDTDAASRVPFCAAALLVWSMSSAPSAGEEPPRTVKISGRILIAKRQGRDIKAATLTAADGTVYQLVIDEKGASLAAVMHRERAEIGGIDALSAIAWDGTLSVLGFLRSYLDACPAVWRREKPALTHDGRR